MLQLSALFLVHQIFVSVRCRVIVVLDEFFLADMFSVSVVVVLGHYGIQDHFFRLLTRCNIHQGFGVLC